MKVILRKVILLTIGIFKISMIPCVHAANYSKIVVPKMENSGGAKMEVQGKNQRIAKKLNKKWQYGKRNYAKNKRVYTLLSAKNEIECKK